MMTHCLEVTGDYACFTRPELKVERMSYDVITPSAARAIFESILWKPAIAWEIVEIDVLKPVRWISLRRNEVASKVPVRTVETAMARGRGLLGLDIEDDRQQRAGLLLRDVAYRIHGRLTLASSVNTNEPLAKYHAMFERRAASGQCVNQPYLGCREFACRFRLVPDEAREPSPIAESRDLGLMLYDIEFANRPGPRPLFFRPRLESGVIRVPPRASTEVWA